MKKRYEYLSFMFRPTRCRFYTYSNGTVRLGDKRTKAVKQLDAWVENLKKQYKDKMYSCWFERSTTRSVFLTIAIDNGR